MSTALVPIDFEGQSVRIVDRGGDPWFVAGDGAKILAYRDAEKLTRLLDDDEKGTHNLSTPGGPQEMSVISEAGLYRAIVQRRARPLHRRRRASGRVPAPRRRGG